MKNTRISFVVVLLALSIISLVAVQWYQLVSTYNRKEKELREDIITFQDKISFRHEKAEDYLRYMKIVNHDFSVQYKDILKSEFKNLVSTQDNITISDTVIFNNGKKEDYLVIHGRTYDSISGLSAEQHVLAKDYREIRDVFKGASKVISGSSDTSRLSVELNQKVIQEIFKKAKFINEMMVQAFKDNVLDTPQKKIDPVFLDSIISFEIRNEHLPKNYSFCVYTDKQEAVVFPVVSKNYNKDIPFNSQVKVNLFPNNTFSNPVYLQIYFPEKNAFILREMTLPIVGSIIVVVLVLVAFFFMFKTIVEQKRLSELKGGFISNMTHEFNTPIATIALACEAIEDDDLIPPQDKKSILPFIQMIRQENQRLEILVESILQSSLLEKQNIEWGKDPVDIMAVTQQVVDNTLFRVGKEQCEIELTAEQKTIIVHCDKLHFRNLISNLVENSVKYSNGVPSVRIEIKQNTQIKLNDKFCL